MTESDQFFRQVENNSFSPPILFGRDTHPKMNHLSDLHAESPQIRAVTQDLAPQTDRTTLLGILHEASLKARQYIPGDLLYARIETGPPQFRRVEIVQPPAPLNRTGCRNTVASLGSV